MADTKVPTKLPKKSIKFTIAPNANEASEKKMYRKTELPRIPSVMRNAPIELPDYETDDDENKAPPERRVLRAASLHWRDDSIRLSRATYEPRLTTLFHDVGMRRRSTVTLRPLERFLPTYQLESNNPFDARAVEDIANEVVNDTISKNVFHPSSFESLARAMTEDILFQIKLRNFDRYRIMVTLTIGEKFYQSYVESLCVIWDIEKDSMATFIYDRSNIFITVNVFGVYYE